MFYSFYRTSVTRLSTDDKVALAKRDEANEHNKMLCELSPIIVESPEKQLSPSIAVVTEIPVCLYIFL